ncbi:PepSY-associated TM helix domain-containing protein [Kocuria rhizophila]|uniref:PepSY-associated TM helix domain-containing protein n=1 Tax=Kocuria rhizophila TaxID=72000 RepID=UPI000AF9166D|nr:PepSY-associated TM helix domain-containing protein [Kocuria rhizophila]
MSRSLDAPSSERARTGSHPTAPWLLPLLRRLHFYAGLFVGPFLVVAALTGALYVFTPQLEREVYAEALTGTTAAQPLTLDQQVAAARRTTGTEESPVNVRPASEGGTTRVMFADPALERGESRAVFVDPGTGRVTGEMTVYGTSGVLPLRTTIDRLHRDLLLGETGRLYSELAASWLGVLALSGVVLVVLHRRRVARGRRARVALVPRPGEANAYRHVRARGTRPPACGSRWGCSCPSWGCPCCASSRWTYSWASGHDVARPARSPRAPRTPGPPRRRAAPHRTTRCGRPRTDTAPGAGPERGTRTRRAVVLRRRRARSCDGPQGPRTRRR